MAIGNHEAADEEGDGAKYEREKESINLPDLCAHRNARLDFDFYFDFEFEFSLRIIIIIIILVVVVFAIVVTVSLSCRLNKLTI